MEKPVIKSILVENYTAKIEITSVKGANIYYTLDGTDPTSESLLYGDSFDYPLPNTVIKAIAILGDDISEISEFTCMVPCVAGSLNVLKSNVKTLIISEPLDFCHSDHDGLIESIIIGNGSINNIENFMYLEGLIYPLGLEFEKYFKNAGDFNMYYWTKGQILTYNNKLIRYDGTSWHTLQEIYSDKFNNKPTVEQGIPIGFAYFCTDKKSPESTQPGLMIYHKGNNVWIDSMNRIVDDNYPKQTKIFVSKEEVSNAINNDLFRSSHNIVTSLSNVPTDKFLVIAEIQTSINQSFSLSGNTLEAGKEIHVIIHNNTDKKLIVTIPDNLPYINCNGESILSILGNSYAEINIISIGDKLYVRTI